MAKRDEETRDQKEQDQLSPEEWKAIREQVQALSLRAEAARRSSESGS